jgi:hypothetical protein
MSKRMLTDTSLCRSRYLVVTDESRVPSPMASPAAIRISTGVRAAYGVT